MSKPIEPRVGERWQHRTNRSRGSVTITTVGPLPDDIQAVTRIGASQPATPAGTIGVAVRGNFGPWWETIDRFVQDWEPAERNYRAELQALNDAIRDPDAPDHNKAYLHPVRVDEQPNDEGQYTATVAAVLELGDFGGNSFGDWDGIPDMLAVRAAATAGGPDSAQIAAGDAAARKFIEALEPVADALRAARGSR